MERGPELVVGPHQWESGEDLEAKLAKASAEYETALSELRAVREAILREDSASVELARRLAHAEKRASEAALRLAHLRERARS